MVIHFSLMKDRETILKVLKDNLKKEVLKMEKQEIQMLFSKEVLKQIKDESLQNIVRGIIFNPSNNINWDDALERIYVNMPGLIMDME